MLFFFIYLDPWWNSEWRFDLRCCGDTVWLKWWIGLVYWYVIFEHISKSLRIESLEMTVRTHNCSVIIICSHVNQRMIVMLRHELLIDDVLFSDEGSKIVVLSLSSRCELSRNIILRISIIILTQTASCTMAIQFSYYL